MALFLGFDSSTQSLSALLLECAGGERRIVFEHTLEFDRELPEYSTRNGVWRQSGSREVTSSPVMWADALDRMMALIADHRGIDLKAIAAVSGAAQQHGSVYLNRAAPAVWSHLNPAVPLAGQLSATFARAESPVWMDESTTAQCAAIAVALGGRQAVAALTGSAPFERFTGPQIRKFSEQDPAGYGNTHRVHLVSSYLASLLCGADAPMDTGDGAGMNLMDIRKLRWAPAALDAVAPDLRQRLPDVVPSWTPVGTLSPYWRDRYGFPAAKVIAWTGDNPSALVGLGLFDEGVLGASLGTSDTLFGASDEPRPTAAGSCHVFGAPSGGYMSLVCFRNGSLAREAVRNQYDFDWRAFSDALRATPAGNHGGMMLPWFEAEITPHVSVPGVHREGLAIEDGNANVRAVVEAQMMAMANRAHLVSAKHVNRVLATGGASVNPEILQVMADVFEAEVVPVARGNAACLGAALRAFHGFEQSEGRRVEWNDVHGALGAIEGSPVRPVPAHAAVYRDLKNRYADFERRSVSG